MDRQPLHERDKYDPDDARDAPTVSDPECLFRVGTSFNIEQTSPAEQLATLFYKLAHTVVWPMTVSPSLTAVINNELIEFDSIKDKIDGLEEAWNEYNYGKPFTDYNHFTYYQIIGLGPFALPILLKKVEEGSNHWFFAMRAIAGMYADTPDMRGNPRAARQAWIDWGRKCYWTSACATSPDVDSPSEQPPMFGSKQHRLE